MNKKYDLVVYIGRFQPFHIAHQETIRVASTISDNVLVLIGSANGPRTIKNPWTFEERKEQILNSESIVYNLMVEPLNDYTYNENKWISQVGEIVSKISNAKNLKRIAVIGHDKDHSSYYLNYFPQWKYYAVPAYPSESDIIDSTRIRELMFNGNVSFIRSVIPESYFGEENPVVEFMKTEEYSLLVEEWKYIKEYKKQWSAAPYAPTFVTVDAIVEQSGHILLIQRGEFPGNGTWAMPGGFIDENEKLESAVIRELREETGLKVPEKVLKGSIIAKDVFDDPGRSTRGRTITHAYLFKLDDGEKLPRVKGGDDAKHAQWISLAEFEDMADQMYEDHWAIVKKMLARR